MVFWAPGPGPPGGPGARGEFAGPSDVAHRMCLRISLTLLAYSLDRLNISVFAALISVPCPLWPSHLSIFVRILSRSLSVSVFAAFTSVPCPLWPSHFTNFAGISHLAIFARVISRSLRNSILAAFISVPCFASQHFCSHTLSRSQIYTILR